MTFSDWLASARLGAGRAEVDVGTDWMQGRSAFGGLQAAAGWLAMRTLVPATVPLRSLQMTFIAPVPAGPLRAEAAVLRAGTSVTHVEAWLRVEEQRCASLIGVFGAARASRVAHQPVRPDIVDPQPTRFPHVQGITPAFTRHFAARWLRGGLPFSGERSRASAVELDLLDAGPCTEAHVLALADFIPPVALSMLTAPTAGSSLTWMLELFCDEYAGLSLSGWRVDSELVAARDGYTSQSNRLWGPDGRLVALSRQSMVVFG